MDFIPMVLRKRGLQERRRPVKRPLPTENPEERADGETQHKKARKDTPDVLGVFSSLSMSIKQQPDPNGERSEIPGAQEHTQSEHKRAEPAKPRGPRFAVPEITNEYLERVVRGLELVFSDWAHQHEEHGKALKKYSRAVNGEENYIHLSILTLHPFLSTLNPKPTQPLISRALSTFPSPYLETDNSSSSTPGNGAIKDIQLADDPATHAVPPISHVRRKPSTYPLPFIPANPSPDFWDARTFYVEPPDRTLCGKPAFLAHHLKTEANFRDKWLPIQAIKPINKLCAFVVLSGDLEVGGMWEKWKKGPAKSFLGGGWRVLTKREHDEREKEYVELREKEWEVFHEKKRQEEKSRKGGWDKHNIEGEGEKWKAFNEDREGQKRSEHQLLNTITHAEKKIIAETADEQPDQDDDEAGEEEPQKKKRRRIKKKKGTRDEIKET